LARNCFQGAGENAQRYYTGFLITFLSLLVIVPLRFAFIISYAEESYPEENKQYGEASKVYVENI